MEITFNQFIKDYRKEYLNNKKEDFTIRSYLEMEYVVDDLYNFENFDIDYESKIIYLF